MRHYRLALMSIYECTMVDTERETTLHVRCTNVEMVDTEREPTPDVRCTNVEQHTMANQFKIIWSKQTKFISES